LTFQEKDSESGKKEHDLDSLYEEIIQGFSLFEMKGVAPFYVRHSTHLSHARSRSAYEKELKRVKSLGVKTESEFVQIAIKNKWWNEEKEREIEIKKDFISRLRETSARAYLEAQRDAANSQILEESTTLNELLRERSSFVSSCAESIAFRKSEEFLLLSSLFEDSDLKIKLFTPDSLEDFSEDDLSPYTSSIFLVSKRMKDENIKILAASSFFQSLLRICEDDSSYHFYGRPVCELTVFQTSLFTYGNFYKKALKNSSEKVPDHVFSDPESLISWCESLSGNSKVKKSLDRNPNAKKTKGERSGRISSIVGATDQDYKNMGLKGDKPQLVKEKGLLELAKESGGSIGIRDAVKATEKIK
jgi:hypothetical protein